MGGTTYYGPVKGHNVISQASQDGPIINNFHGSQATRHPSYIPYFRNNDVVQRPDLVKRLSELLSPIGGGQRVALYGLGGSGKTSLALQFAYEKSRDTSVPCSVFWVHAEDEATFTQSYVDIGRKLEVDTNKTGDELLQTVKFAMMRESPWLLVIDNADDLGLFGFPTDQPESPRKATGGDASTRKSLFRHIPNDSKGTILWTTRDANVLDTLAEGQKGVAVARMKEEEARELFDKALGHYKVTQEAEKEARDVLLQELEWLPLAVSQAASFIRQSGTSIDDYLKQLKHDRRRWEVLSKPFYDISRPEGATSSVLATWDVSVRRLKKYDWLAYEMLHLVAFVDNQDVPQALLVEAAAWSIKNTRRKQKMDDEAIKGRAGRAVKRLVDFSFLMKRKSEDDDVSYEMHKLVQEGVRYMLKRRHNASAAPHDRRKNEGQIKTNRKASQARSSLSEAIKNLSLGRLALQNRGKYSECRMREGKEEGGKRYARGALSVVEKLFPRLEDALDPKHQRVCEKYLAHAMRVADSSGDAEENERMGLLLQRISNYLYAHRRDWAQEAVDTKAFELLRSVLGDSHPNVLRSVADRIIGLRSLGRYDDAELVAKQALEICRKRLGENHRETLWIKWRLAEVYCSQGRLDEAERLATRVCQISETKWGEHHFLTLQSQQLVAWIYTDQRRFDEAEKALIKLGPQFSEMYGETSHDTTEIQASLAGVWREQGRYDEAEKLLIDVLEHQRRVWGVDHPETLVTKHTLGCVYYGQGRCDEAERLERHVLDVRQQIFGELHPSTLTTQLSLAQILWEQGQLDVAFQMMEQVAVRCAEVFGEEYKLTKSSRKQLAIWKERSKASDTSEERLAG